MKFPRLCLVHTRAAYATTSNTTIAAAAESAAGSSTHHHHHHQELDDQGNPINEMTALPFNRSAEHPEPPDWTRRIFVVGYMGGLAGFMFLWHYKPDTSLEGWAWGEAERRMKERGADLAWLQKPQILTST